MPSIFQSYLTLVNSTEKLGKELGFESKESAGIDSHKALAWQMRNADRVEEALQKMDWPLCSYCANRVESVKDGACKGCYGEEQEVDDSRESPAMEEAINS